MKQCSEKWLLIDNSNSRTKFTFAVEGILSDEVFIVPTAELSVEKILQLLQEHHFSRVVVSSVVPACVEIFNATFAQPVHYVSATSPSFLSYNYEGVETLGADRIANAVAVAAGEVFPCIAIDAGTATTFDVVVARGAKRVYVGGAIAPGYASFGRYLHRCTAQLPQVELNKNACAIGKNTKQAMQSGALYGFCGMVRGVISAIEAELGCRARIVLTGGDAELLSTAGNIRGEWVKNLTFQGLLHVAQRL